MCDDPEDYLEASKNKAFLLLWCQDPLTAGILRGEEGGALRAERRSVRLYLASTFTDSKRERDHLVRHVFPAVRDLCQHHGVEFSVVDVHWGSRDYPLNNHLMPEISHSEIQKCIQSTIPGAPCFLYLAFNRYGCPPLPRLVPAREMETLVNDLEDGDVKQLVVTWYKKDWNAKPAVYVLQPVSTFIPQYVSKDAEKRKLARNEWCKMTESMMTALAEVAKNNSNITAQQEERWRLSTTHQEVLTGLLESEEGAKRGFCYSRDIEEFKSMKRIDERLGEKVWRYLDTDPEEENVDSTAQTTLRELRARVRDHGVPTRSYTVPWTKKGVDEVTHGAYLKQLGEDVLTDLTGRIQGALRDLPPLEGATAEIVSHVTYLHRRSVTFHGRADLVEKAMKYFDPGSNAQNKGMMVLYGVAGAGKTTLTTKLISMAREALTDENALPIVVSRVCGISQFSSSARALMTSMCQQIAQCFQTEVSIPMNFGSLKHTFEQMLRKATFCNPLLVFINNLDHLTDEDNGRADLTWLPTSLPPNVYLVVSCCIETGGCLESLKSKELPDGSYLEVGPLTKEDSSTILKGWLDESGRKLTLAQFNHVNQFALDSSKETPNVLRLKLLFDSAVKWTSFDPLPQFSNTISGLIGEYFTHLERAHGKPLITVVCSLLGASMHGLPENDIIDLISTDDTLLSSVLTNQNLSIKRLPRQILLRLRHDLGSNLIDRFDYGRSVLFWFHRQFRVVAERRYLTGETADGLDKKTSYSKYIAAYYSEVSHKTHPNKLLAPQPLYWTSSQGETIFNLTKLTELPNSIAQCPSETAVQLNSKCICNLGFMAAKSAAGLSKELLADLNKSITRIKDKRLKTYNIFLSKNIHILEQDPSLALQQMKNMPDNLEELHQDIKGLSSRDITPWIPADKILHTAFLVNKPTGIHPCNITISANDSLPGRTFSDVKMIDIGHRSYFIVCSTIWGWNDKIDVYDRYTGKLALRIDGHKVKKTGGTIREVRLCKSNDSSFHILCRNFDEVHIKVITISVGETLMAFLGGFIDGDWISKTKGNTDQVNFEVSHDMTRIISYVMKREEFEGEGTDKDGFKTTLAVWDVQKCVEKKFEEVCKTPLVFRIGSEKFTTSKKTGYGVGAVAFSPDDKYIVMSLTRPVETGNPITIIETKTLNPVWLWLGYGRFQCSCIHTYKSKLAPNTFNLVLTGASYRGNKYGIAVHATKSGQVVSKNLWKGMGYEVTGLSTFPEGNEAQLVFRLNNTIRLVDIPQVSQSDYKKWEVPPEVDNTEYEAMLEEGLEFADFDTTIVSMSTGDGSDCCTLSKSGEVKLCDLSLCAEYKAPDKLPSAIIASYLSHDNTLLYTHSSHGVCAWNSKTGKLVGTYKIRGTLKVMKPDTDSPAVTSIYKGTSIAVSSQGQVFGFCEDNFMVYLTAADVQQATGEKWVDTADLNCVGFHEVETQGGSTERVEASPHMVPNHQLSLSPDGRWIAVAMRYSKKLNLCLIDTKTKKPVHRLVHDHPQITDGLFESLYRGTFSNDGRYLAAWGSMHIVYTKVRSNHGCTADIWPPLIKLFEFGADGSLRDVAATQSAGHRPPYRPGDALRQDSKESPQDEYRSADLTSLVFLPGDKHIITATKDGFVELREVPKLEVGYKLKAHEEAVTCVQGVRYKQAVYVITGSLDKWVYVYKLAQVQHEMRVRLNSRSALPSPVSDAVSSPRQNNYVENGDGGNNLRTSALKKSVVQNGVDRRPGSAGGVDPPRPRSGSGVRLDPLPGGKRPSSRVGLQRVAKYYNDREVTAVTAFIDGETLYLQVCDSAGRVNIVRIPLQ